MLIENCGAPISPHVWGKEVVRMKFLKHILLGSSILGVHLTKKG